MKRKRHTDSQNILGDFAKYFVSPGHNLYLKKVTSEKKTAMTMATRHTGYSKYLEVKESYENRITYGSNPTNGLLHLQRNITK